jgi:sugar phosphate isomerase/epimerase
MKLTFHVVFAAATLLANIFLTGCATAPPEVGIGPSFKGPLGLQLWSLRTQFRKDVPGTVKVVKDFGFKYAELANGTYKVPTEQFRDELLASGIKPISDHFAYDMFRTNLDEVVREAETLGLEYAGCAYITHKGEFDEKVCREAIDVFNHAGEVLAQHHIKFFYHVHGIEFEPYGNGTLFNLLMDETNPKYVHYEMDIFWIVYPGQDPVKLLHQYQGRWELMHLKDMSKDLKTGPLTGEADSKNDVSLGMGQMDIPAILKAAKEVGIKWYFIEDESHNSEQQIPVTLRYLEQVKF